MEQNSILGLMIAQHGLIEALFVAFRDEAKNNPEQAIKFLNEFSWETKKHFFIEEEAIFDSFVWKKKEVFETVRQLEREHEVMLELIKRAVEKIPETEPEKLDAFHLLMEKHRETEEKILYPELDKELSEAQKVDVIRRINEIPMKKV